MGKFSSAKASRSDSKCLGSTLMETETKAPSRPHSALALMPHLSHPAKRAARKQKTLEPKGVQGRDVFEQTDSPLALFFVVAIRRAGRALNQSTSALEYHCSIPQAIVPAAHP